ncbi:MAG: hypothetical protein B5M55_00890 [Desulfococcus sp. 4484_242]|nr:MAG: hypothetical protein B5M55_00890 [Desulfococcus sp. 4484_242]
MIKEISAKELNPEQFIQEKVAEIKAAAGEGLVVNALSGGVDSSTVTMLGHRALGDQLKTVFIENGLMRQGEAEQVVGFFRGLGVRVDIVDAREAFGYQIIEPLIQLRKDGVRMVGKALGLPSELFNRIPFPGPALSARVIGEATPERIETVRKATVVVERHLKGSGAFQYMGILHEDRVTGMRNGKRDFGRQIEVRCWDSVDARTATPTRLSFEILEQIAGDIIREVPGIVSVTYHIAPKPPSTIEAV